MPKKAKLELLDPQQIELFRGFTDPDSETYGDLKNSAIQAGYSESYASAISGLMPKWLYESICQESLLRKAERNLDKFLDMADADDPALKKIKLDATKFVAARAGRGKWSEKQEIETKNLNLNVTVDVHNEQAEKLARDYEEEMKKLIQNAA